MALNAYQTNSIQRLLNSKEEYLLQACISALRVDADKEKGEGDKKGREVKSNKLSSVSDAPKSELPQSDARTLPPLPAELVSGLSLRQVNTLRRSLRTCLKKHLAAKAALFFAADLEYKKAHSMSSRERRQNGTHLDRNLTYGEIPFESMVSMLWDPSSKVELPAHGGVFFDLGSGCGKGVVAAHLLHDFQVRCSTQTFLPMLLV